jgi:hypothetical protein
VTPFEHLSVLISIILGLGITHLLANVNALAQARGRVRLHWLPVVWSVLVFVGLVQWWWGSFDMHTAGDWNFFFFLFVLLRPVVAYLSAAFVLPQVEPGVTYDLREYYFRNRYWLFLLLAGGNVLDGLRRMMTGQQLEEIAVWSNFVSSLIVASLAFVTSERYHAVVTGLTVALYGTFIMSSALELTADEAPRGPARAEVAEITWRAPSIHLAGTLTSGQILLTRLPTSAPSADARPGAFDPDRR